MQNLVEEQSLNKNEFLSELEEWSEDDVYKYKSKVRGQVLYGFFVMILGYFFTMLAGSMLVGLLYSFVIELSFGKYLHILITALQLFVTYLVFCSHGSKKGEKFITENHGEVGHPGHRYMRRIILSKWICLLLTIGYAGFNIYNQVTDGGWASLLENFSAMMMFVAIPFSAFAYFVGVENEMYTGTCPVCGRLNTTEKTELKSFGDRVDGQHETRKNYTKQTGTLTTTTYWSDGSTTSHDSPIYSDFTKVEVYDEHSKLCDYMITCRECTYHAMGTEKQNYNVKVDEYDVRR